MEIPEDLEWTCGEEDDEYIYQNNDDVTISDCSDLSTVYDLVLDIDVEIEELGCVSPGDPGVLRRIRRTFVYDTGDPLDVSCPVYGPGFICETQVIEVRDITDPTFLEVPDNVEIECNEWVLKDYLLENTFNLVFDDNCETPTLQTSYAIDEETECSAEKSYIFTFTLTDVCGNETQDTHVVNVVDMTPPEIIFTPSQLEIGVFNCVGDTAWPEISAFDMCSSASVEWDDLSTVTTTPLAGPSCDNNVRLERIARAEDDCGNMIMQEFTIEIQDLDPPFFSDFVSELPDVTLSCDETLELEAILLIQPSFEDGCSSVPTLTVDTAHIPSGICPQNYIIERTFIIEDECENTSDPIIQTIIIEDIEAPTITLPTEGFPLECTEPLILEAPVVEDNCDFGIISLTIDTVETGDLSDGDLISTITYIATDACGNISESVAVVVNIVDTEPPFFTSFPIDLNLLCGDVYPNDSVSYEDDCDPDAYLVNYDLGFDFQPCANNTLITRTFIISDNSENEATQTQEITFLDLDPPILLTPLDSLFYQCAYEVPECLEIFEGLEFDDCSSGDVVPIDCDDVEVEGDCEEQACIIERTYLFEDACGNQGSAKQYITVQESVLNPEMPTGITPNGDGLNDAFVIKGIGPSVNPEPGEVQCDWLEDTNMRVINRWGSLVFEEANYRNDWEGTNESGEDLPQGTYFVVFEALGESFSTYLDLRR